VSSYFRAFVINFFIFKPVWFRLVRIRRITMERKKYVSWQDDDMWLGYLDEYPDYMTQGKTLEELKENLIDIFNELNRELD
jgi:hypothetical protein